MQERWDFFQFDPPVVESYAASIINEWLKIESKPKAEAYFDKIAPNELVFATAYVKVRMIDRHSYIRDIWTAGVKLSLSDLTFDNIATLLDRVGGYETNTQIQLIRVEIAYQTLPRMLPGYAAPGIKTSSKRATRRKAVRGVRH